MANPASSVSGVGLNPSSALRVACGEPTAMAYGHPRLNPAESRRGQQLSGMEVFQGALHTGHASMGRHEAKVTRPGGLGARRMEQALTGRATRLDSAEHQS